MSKSTFNLEKPQFSDSDEQTPIQLNNNMLSAYNKQYSLIYQQISTFLKQCKDNIFKYISLNQFGVGFNICNIFSQINKMETSMLSGISDVEKQQLDHKKNMKSKYEKEFENLIDRMGTVIQDFLKFQIEFKRQYFGLNLANVTNSKSSSNQKNGLRLYQSPALQKKGSQRSVYSGQSIRKKLSISSHSRQSQQKKQYELEQKLRDILKRKLAPQKQNIIKFCDKGSDPQKNLSKLEQKMDMMQSEIILSKNREEKIIQIFNKRRVENIQPKGQNIVHCELIQTDEANRKNKYCQSSSHYKIKNKRQEPIQQFKDGNLKMKPGFAKPILDFQAVNRSIFNENQNAPTSSSTIYGANLIGAPKKLISPRGFKSVKQSSVIGSSFHFFNSPKSYGLTKKGPINKSPVNFRKKKQNQTQMKQNFSQQNILQKEIQIEPNKVLENQDQGEILNISTTKNRAMFMRRRSNNQTLPSGVSNLIEEG